MPRKRPWITQQRVVRCPVEFQFFRRTVDANQRKGFREEGRVAEIHLIVQASAHHQRDVGFLKGKFGGGVLVKVGHPHVGFRFFAQQFLVVGNVENRNVQRVAHRF